MKELFQTIFDNSKERIKNPFVGSYIVSFIVYNWRPISIYLFSDETIEDTISTINTSYCAIPAFLWPLTISLFYVLILPYINVGFDWILKKANAAKVQKQRALKIDTLNQKIEEAHLERNIADAQAGTSQINELNDKITRLENEANLKTKQLNDFTNQHNVEVENLARTNEILREERLHSNREYEELRMSYSKQDKIYNLLTNMDRDLFLREIRIFFRSHLEPKEVLTLKQNINSIFKYNSLPFTKEVSALLVKGEIFKFHPSERVYYITEAGKKFVADLD